MKYQIAMLNSLKLGDYQNPTSILGESCEYLIVTRIDEGGEFLIITEAGLTDCDSKTIPDNPPLNLSLVGTLVRSDSDEKHQIFIFNRSLPTGLDIPGSFFPADGYAEVIFDGENSSMVVSGRHAFERNRDPVTGNLVHQSEPITDLTGARSWHFDAQYLPWTNEQLT